jgi:RNA polymerase sigma factor (sigma-70 family)
MTTVSTATSELELVRAAGAGDSRAFEQLWHTHHAFARGVAFQETRDDGLADDAAAEAFLQLWQGKWRPDPDRQPEGEQPLRPFVAGFVRMVARNLLAQHRRRMDRPHLVEHQIPEFDDGTPAVEAQSRERDPERQLLDNEMRERLADAFAALTPDQREIARMRWFTFEEMSIADIAAATGKSFTAVGTHLTRIRQSLAYQLFPVYSQPMGQLTRVHVVKPGVSGRAGAANLAAARRKREAA